jgi:hypothetical protein
MTFGLRLPRSRQQPVCGCLSSVYGHIERTTSHRRDGFVECCKNPGFADSRRDLVSVQVGSKVWTNTREDDADPFVSQMIE